MPRLSESERDKRILASWDRHDDGEISDERLYAMVEDDTGSGVGRVFDALQRAGRVITT